MVMWIVNKQFLPAARVEAALNLSQGGGQIIRFLRHHFPATRVEVTPLAANNAKQVGLKVFSSFSDRNQVLRC